MVGCRLVEDTAWHPVSKEELLQWKGTFKGWLFKTFLGSPLKSWASVGHWLIWHFDTTKYSDKQQNRVSTSASIHCSRPAKGIAEARYIHLDKICSPERCVSQEAC